MKRRPIRALALMLASLLACTGCGSANYETGAPDYTVGVVLKTQESEHWLRIRSGMERAAEEENVRLLLAWPTDELSTGEQRDIIADMLRCDIDALVVAPCDSWDCGWFRTAAEEKGILVFTTDTAALDCAIPYIGSDHQKIGRTAAGYLQNALPAGSKVGVVAGFQGQQSLAARTDAFRTALATDSRLRLLRVEPGCLSFASALDAARSLIEDGADALFCTSAVLGLGAAAAVRETDAAVRIVAVDTQDDALKAVETGAFDALITQSGEEIGRRTIETVAAALRGKTPPGETYIAGEVLTADNIAEFLSKEGEETWSVS
ncbi:MAG: substrate-binding domain-containing protein [Butyricicoccus pullicaecorum]|nr:substrate-binding domain-containing protein [Butyricicoccus pullicaecorum]